MYHELILKLLDACEMQCVMCGQLSQENRRTKLSLSSLTRYFGGQSFNQKRVYLWGGEPLLHHQLHEIISFFKNRGAFVAMNTNGYKLERHLEQLVENKLDRIIFSMDGSDALTHDQIRGVPGSFDRLQKNITNLQELKRLCKVPRIRINFVVLPRNYRQVLEVLAWCKERGVYRVHFQLPIFLTNEQLESYANLVRTECGCSIRNYRAFLSDFSDIDFSVIERSMRAVFRQHQGFARFHPYEYLNAEDLQTYFTTTNILRRCRCDVLTDRLAIDASGRFVTCPDFPDISFGDLDHGVTHPERLDRLRQLVDSGGTLPTCHRCCHFVPQN